MSKTKKRTLVSDVMSDVVEVLQAGDTLDLAERLMRAGRIRHLPVVDGEQHLVGLVTHRKILGAWVGHGHPLKERHQDIAREIPIEMLMEKNVLTIWPGAPAAEAARLLETNKIGCLPIVDDGKLVGIITEADFVRFAREHLERETGA
jgi:CBS domain-containing membrane protein